MAKILYFCFRMTRWIKRYFAVPLFFVYFFAVSGVIIQQSCCDISSPFEEMTSGKDAHSCCQTAATKQTQEKSLNKKGCCHQTITVVKTIHNQLFEKSRIQFLKLAQSLPGIIPSSRFFVFSFSKERQESIQTSAPPGNWQHIPLYKLHQRFTYYG